MKTIVIDPSKCSGCRLCELGCSLKNAGEFNPVRSRIQVIGFDEPFALPVTCFQCEKPYCMEVCPSRAITKDEITSVVKVSSEKCVGCKMCTLACPFGNIVFSSEERSAVKCQLCDGNPECVTFCPTQALEFKVVDTGTARKRAHLTEKVRAAYEGLA